MYNSGMSFISIIIGVVVIAILSLTLIRNSGIRAPKTSEVAVKKAEEVECQMKVRALNHKIKVYEIENEKFPQSLEELTDELLCPISDFELRYDRRVGKVWCPEHK